MAIKWAKKRSVMRRYDATAWMYDARYAEEQEAKYNVALEPLKLDDGSFVLDVGCGSGLFFAHAAEKAATVVGVDASRQLLLLAKHRSKRYENTHLVLADNDHLPFKPGLFSHVFAFTVLQNMPNPAETLKEAQTVSKTDASFVVTGLKAVLSIDALKGILAVAGLQTTSFQNDDATSCHVLTCVRRC